MPLAEPLTRVPCLHCGERCDDGEVYCCAGCRTVHELLSARGLTGYYALAEGEERRPARASERTYEELDSETFTERWVETAADGARTVDVYLEGVHCQACVWLVEKLPRLAPGTLEARLDLGRSVARLSWDPDATHLSELARALDRLGYRVHPAHDRSRRERYRDEDRAALTRLAVAGALAGNVMLISFALYGGALASMEPVYTTLFRWAALLLTIPAVLGPGRVFLRGAWSALRTRTPHMDLPVGLALTIGLAWGAINTIRGAGEVYFDTVSVLVFLLLVGRWVSQKQRRAAADAAGLLQALAPSTARIVRGAETALVPLEALVAGDVVEVRPGEILPADGPVLEGRSHLDTSLLTGESRPTRVGVGDLAHAGTLNQTATLHLRVDAVAAESRLGKLLEQVEACQRARPPIVRWADRIAGAFVSVVLTLAALTLAVWMVLDPGQAVDNAVALLIITCPCALGLATPLAIGAAISRAARRGVLVKGPDALQQLEGRGRLWLDKTGTLTEGQVSLLDWSGPERAQALVLALEEGSTHPLARGLRQAFAGVTPLTLDAPPERIGGGRRSTLAGAPVLVGSPACVRRAGVALPDWARAELEGSLAAGRTPVLVAEGDAVLAVAGCGDRVRPEAPEVIERLRAAGWELGILSGDHPQVVEAVARELGIADARGGLLPEDKLAIVQSERAANGATVMVGDGVNDAAALAAADTGIGVHGSSEATLEAADVFLARPGLAALDDLLGVARRALRTVRANLAISLAYNVIGAALAMAGIVSPLVAAVLMPLSSLAVVANSYRIALPGRSE